MFKESFMQQQKTAIRAAIDIGSNTIEVLIARCVPDNLEIRGLKELPATCAGGQCA
jgi:cell division ATPase FtsA